MFSLFCGLNKDCRDAIHVPERAIKYDTVSFGMETGSWMKTIAKTFSTYILNVNHVRLTIFIIKIILHHIKSNQKIELFL